MHVVATAGHVDHGKSTLVRALTGMEPDRFAEERRRGLTIDLGYAWTTLEGGQTLAFVDVPGHERFIATMLAGLGPAPAVLFVVAADEGWRRQSEEHLAAVDALGLQHGLLVVTRSDLADPRAALAQASLRLAESSLGSVPAVSVSATSGQGLAELRSALRRLVTGLPPARRDGRVRLWVDRSFTIRGAGTVVTGTLGGGTMTVGEQLQHGDRLVRVRGLQILGEEAQQVGAVARVAVNLRGVEVDQIGRGDALLTPDAWPATTRVDVRCASPPTRTSELPSELMLHLGTAAVPVRVRPLGGPVTRLTLHRPLAIEPGDRLVLRDPGRHAVAAGAVVLDADPPPLRRRGAASARAMALEQTDRAHPAAVLAEQVRQRGIVRRTDLEALGISTVDASGVHAVGDWLVDRETWDRWQQSLREAVGERARTTPLDPRLSVEAARRAVGVPDRGLLVALTEAAGLRYSDGRVEQPGADRSGLGAAEAGLARLEQHLSSDPFGAPEKPDLDGWGLGLRELAAAERTGRLVRLGPDVVLLPAGPAQAMRVLARLPQPFTTSQARQALGTTRRVAIPLLEHLDRRGWTLRVDSGHRRVKIS
jgi:selenocysteine-specific elongation factor